MPDPVIVQIPFSRRTKDGTVFTDALNLSIAEYEAADPNDLDAQKDARFAAWEEAIAIIPPPPPPPTIEDFDTEKSDTLEQFTRLFEKVAGLAEGPAFVKELLLQLAPVADAVGVDIAVRRR